MPDHDKPTNCALLPPHGPFDNRPLWQLIVALLPSIDAGTEWFSPADIAPLVNLTPHALLKHCRDLWPNHEGQWRLNYSQAVSVIRRVCAAGRKLPARADLLEELRRRGSGPTILGGGVQ